MCGRGVSWRRAAWPAWPAWLCAWLSWAAVAARADYGFVTWEGDRPRVVITEAHSEGPKSYIARGTFTNEINETGWSYLEVHTTASCSDERQALAAGFLEGVLTRDLIWMHWQNLLKSYCHNKVDVCSMIDRYLNENEKFLSEMIESNAGDPYWYQLKLYYIQLKGLALGYRSATADPDENLSVRDIYWINMTGDLDELVQALSAPRDQPGGLLFAERCSGLVKLLADNAELYVAHSTWNSYQSMLRIQKLYVLNYRTQPGGSRRVPGYKMSFSSYPAFAHSTDDFYIISSGLAAAETTFGNSNRSLLAAVRPRGAVLEHARAQIANRLARTGQQWSDLFRRYNSGTYNNQWYIVDYKKFKTNSSLEPGLLWVVEQLPGLVQAADMTPHLERERYWPSYNIPYFPLVFNMSGGNARVAAFGDWWAYDTNPRAAIFRDKQGDVTDLQSMFELMRYCDFKHDAYGRCAACRPPYSGCNAVSARNDLNPANGSYPFRALGHRSHGGTDTKVTSARLRRDYQFIAVSSPSYNIARGIPPFTWSEFDLGRKLFHVGHPDVWAFPPVRHVWQWAGAE